MKPLQALPPVEPDATSGAFFAAAREGRLMVQRCTRCGTVQLGNTLCDECQCDALEWIAASGCAAVHSFVVMHVAYHPAFATPYTAVLAELEEGPRLPVLLVDDGPVAIGEPVTIAFAPGENDTMLPVARRR